MRIEATQLSKRFANEWIFKSFSHTFSPGESYAILGQNGSGKSTLLKVLAGMTLPTSGAVSFILPDGNAVPEEEHFRYLSFAAPYMDLIDHFTFTETVAFYSGVRKMLSSPEELIHLAGLEKFANTQIRLFSSGMRQKVRLALAFLTDSPIIILDEPTSNLDYKNISWFENIFTHYAKDRIVLMGSNYLTEYRLCQHTIKIEEFKPAVQGGESSRQVLPIDTGMPNPGN